MNQETTTTQAAFGTLVKTGIHLVHKLQTILISPVFHQSPFSVLGYHITFGN